MSFTVAQSTKWDNIKPVLRSISFVMVILLSLFAAIMASETLCWCKVACGNGVIDCMSGLHCVWIFLSAALICSLASFAAAIPLHIISYISPCSATRLICASCVSALNTFLPLGKCLTKNCLAFFRLRIFANRFLAFCALPICAKIILARLCLPVCFVSGVKADSTPALQSVAMSGVKRELRNLFDLVAFRAILRYDCVWHNLFPSKSLGRPASYELAGHSGHYTTQQAAQQPVRQGGA